MTKTKEVTANRPRFYCTENEWNCPGGCEGEHSRTKPVDVSDLLRTATTRFVDGYRAVAGHPFSLTSNTDGNALLVDVADPTGPNGQRSFVVEFTVREVT